MLIIELNIHCELIKLSHWFIIFGLILILILIINTTLKYFQVQINFLKKAIFILPIRLYILKDYDEKFLKLLIPYSL